MSVPANGYAIDIIHGTGLETLSINTFRPGQSVLRAGGGVSQFARYLK